MSNNITIRHGNQSGWTAVPHTLTEDSSISWKAKALWVWLASRPSGWTVRLSHLTTQATDGIGSVRSGLDELESAGYISRRQIRGDDGRFVSVEYTINGAPHSENPHTEKPHTENPTLNKKKSNKKKASISRDHQDLFKTLWSKYPSRGEHPHHYMAGLKAFDKALRDGCELTDLVAAVKRYAKYIEANKTDPQYVITTARFFSERWREFQTDVDAPKVSRDGMKFL